MTIEEKLKENILSKYKSIRAFTQEVDIPYSTIDTMLKKGISRAGVSTIIRVCNNLNIDVDALERNEILPKPNNISFTLSTKEQTYIKKYRSLDEYGKTLIDNTLDHEYNRNLEQQLLEQQKQIDENTIDFIQVEYSDYPASAGTGLFMFDDIKTTTIEVPLNNITRNADLVIPVNGDSMEPMYDDGDRVAIEYRPTLEVGEIGIFIVDGEVYIKEFQKNKLVSLNPKYKPIYFNENTSIKFIGKVLGKIK